MLHADQLNKIFEVNVSKPELSTGRMDPRVGSGQVGSRFCRILAGRVWSALRIFKFLLIISWYLNR